MGYLFSTSNYHQRDDPESDSVYNISVISVTVDTFAVCYDALC